MITRLLLYLRSYLDRSDRRARLASFLDGFAAAFDWSPSPLRRLHRTDSEALASDWEAIGQDMRRVIERAERELDRKPRAMTAEIERDREVVEVFRRNEGGL